MADKKKRKKYCTECKGQVMQPITIVSDETMIVETWKCPACGQRDVIGREKKTSEAGK